MRLCRRKVGFLKWMPTHPPANIVEAKARCAQTPAHWRDSCPLSPIHHRAVVQIVGLAITPVVVEFVGDLVFVEFNAESGAFRDSHITVLELERLLEVAVAKSDLFLSEKVRDGRGQL